MKNGKLAALLNIPARALIAVGMIIIVVELLIMIVIEDVFPPSMHKFLYLLAPILLIVIVSPALYFLIFRPMRRQQAELEDAHKRIGQAFQEWIAALDAVNDPIFLHDKDFRILRCNKAYQQCAGLPFKQIIGRSYYEVFPKTDSPLPNCLHAMEKAEEKEEEVTIGAAIYRSRAYSIHNEHGAYLYSIHTLEDITESKRAEQALSESEQLYHSLFENMLNGFAYCQMIFEQDQPQDFIYLGVNAAFETQTGLRNVVGKRVSEVIPGIRQSDAKLFEIYGRVSLSGKPERFEIYVEALQQWFWISVYSPKKSYFVAIFDVITERKRAEATLQESKGLLQSVVENAPVRIFWKDRDSRYLGCNTRFAKDVGRVGPDDLTGKTDFDMGWKDQAELYRADDKAVMESGIPKLGFEEPQTTPDGNMIWLRTSKVPLRDESNRVIGILGIYEDITERKQAEAKLAEQIEELRRWNDATLGREMRVLELKREVNELLGQSGHPPRYMSAVSDNPLEK